MRPEGMDALGMGCGAPSKRSLAALVVVGQLLAGTAWAAPAPVRINVTGERLDPKDAKALEPFVREAAEGYLRGEHGVVIEDGAKTEVKIELRPFGTAKARDAVIFRVTVSTDGNELYAGHPTSWFKEDDTELVAVVRTRVTEAVGHLPELRDAEAVPGDQSAIEEEDAAEAAEEMAETTEPSVEDGRQPTAPALTLRNAGLGLVIPGGVALGVGIGLVAVGKREVYPTNEEEIGERDFRTPGAAMLIVGGIVAAAGVGLLVAHTVRVRKRNDRKGERLMWSPVIDGTHAGAVLGGRF